MNKLAVASMKKHLKQLSLVALLLLVFACSTTRTSPQPHEQITKDLIAILAETPELEQLLLKSIEMAKETNPDKKTNPAQSLDEYYEYLNWSVKAMPWNVLSDAHYPTIFETIDQNVCYFYFILDQPLPELEGKGYYYNSLQYVPELHAWLTQYAKDWGAYLSTPESWNDEYYELMKSEERFNLNKGWYEDPANWRTWNEFFARYLSSADIRPIVSPDDNSVVVSPADSEPQGVWQLDENSDIISTIQVKSRIFSSVSHLLGPNTEYANTFAGGTLTHTFLNVDDYHRYHFPVSGTIKEVEMIQAQDAAGGITIWDAEKKKYILLASDPGWQMIETRGLVIVETEEHGNVAILPIGMSQISSVVFEETVKVGAKVQKGDMLGCFLFGGSNIVMVFEKKANFEFTVPKEGDTYKHLFMGQEYGRLRK